MQKAAIYSALVLLTLLPWTSAQTSKEAETAFQWFESLGYPDLKNAPFVEVWNRETDWETPTGARTRFGFLLRNEKSRQFEVIFLQLNVRTFRTYASTNPLNRVGFEERSLDQWGASFLASPAEERSKLSGLELFVLADVCRQKGNAELAQKFYIAAAGDKPNPDFQKNLETALAELETWKAWLLFGGLELEGGRSEALVPRAEILNSLRLLAKRFPGNAYLPNVTRKIAILIQMEQEDASHPALSEEQIKLLPEQGQVSEWIFQLRNQNGHQFMGPGVCDVFDRLSDSTEKTPADQLLKLGFAAVPQLIEVLSDERLSRSVGFHRSGYFSHTVLTFGDCAEQILSRMAGQRFFLAATTQSYMSRDGQVTETKAAAEKWWQQVQTLGEEQVLFNTIASGEFQSGEAIQKLKSLAPAKMPEALLAGARNAKSRFDLQFYLDELGEYRTPEVFAFLLTKLHGAKGLETRLAAAVTLWKQGDPTALPAMLNEWGKTSRKGNFGGFQDLSRFLVYTGDPQAIKILGTDWDSRDDFQHFMILQGVGHLGQPWVFTGFHEGNRPRPKALLAAENLLASSLRDSTTLERPYSKANSFRMSNVRLGEFALLTLSDLLPGIYTFSGAPSQRRLTEARRRALEIWSRRSGTPSRPVQDSAMYPKLKPEEALTITSVVIYPPPPKSYEAFFAKISALKGTVFNAKTLPTIQQNFASETLEGLEGLKITASREEDLTGVTLEVRLQPGVYATSDNWRLFWGADAEEICRSDRADFPREKAALEETYAPTFGKIEKHLKLPPTAYFTISWEFRTHR